MTVSNELVEAELTRKRFREQHLHEAIRFSSSQGSCGYFRSNARISHANAPIGSKLKVHVS